MTCCSSSSRLSQKPAQVMMSMAQFSGAFCAAERRAIRSGLAFQIDIVCSRFRCPQYQSIRLHCPITNCYSRSAYTCTDWKSLAEWCHAFRRQSFAAALGGLQTLAGVVVVALVMTAWTRLRAVGVAPVRHVGAILGRSLVAVANGSGHLSLL